MQSLAVSAVISLWLGDLSSVIVAIPSSLATLKYSREFEYDADAFAIDAMRKVGLSTRPMADLLEALEASADEAKDGDKGGNEPGQPEKNSSANTERRSKYSELWSTHPITSERIKRLRAP